MNMQNPQALKPLQLRLRANIQQMNVAARCLRPAAQPQLQDVQKMRILHDETGAIIAEIEKLFEGEK